jgi:anthranilate phosphoribosyltransferase
LILTATRLTDIAPNQFGKLNALKYQYLTMTKAEHPFASFIRIIGKGKKGSRSLTMQEAEQAMEMILSKQVTEEQLGAFLMLLRVKEETAEELAGFVSAAKMTINSNPQPLADLDWSTYAGKKRRLPWFFLSALLLSKNGIRVAMHGAQEQTADRIYTEMVLPLFNLSPSKSIEEAQQSLTSRNFCYLPIESLSPTLAEIIALRRTLGLRSPVHTLCRLLNPLNAPFRIDGVFHPAYGPIHAKTAQLLKQAECVTIKGDGGEAEIKPDSDCTLQWLQEGKYQEEIWQRRYPKRLLNETDLDINELPNLWTGEINHPYGEGAVIETTAVCLKLLKRTKNSTEAKQLAEGMWAKRDKNHFNQ